MEALLEKIEAEYLVFRQEGLKAQEGNKAAGARARKASNNLGKLLKTFRAISVQGTAE